MKRAEAIVVSNFIGNAKRDRKKGHRDLLGQSFLHRKRILWRKRNDQNSFIAHILLSNIYADVFLNRIIKAKHNLPWYVNHRGPIAWGKLRRSRERTNNNQSDTPIDHQHPWTLMTRYGGLDHGRTLIYLFCGGVEGGKTEVENDRNPVAPGTTFQDVKVLGQMKKKMRRCKTDNHGTNRQITL